MLILVPVQCVFLPKKELRFRGKDRFIVAKFGNGKVWMWRRQKALLTLFSRLERIFFNLKKKRFL